MQSPFAFIRRWSVTLLCWAGMVALAVLIGQRLGPLYAYAAWVGVALLLSGAGALLIKSQPLGKATAAGMAGYQVTHFGFKAGHGQLGRAAMISWAVWCVVGTAAVWVTHGWGAAGGWGADSRWLRLAMGASWCVDALGLMYIWGVVLSNRPRPSAPEMTGHPTRVPRSLAKLMALLAAVMAASAAMWFGSTQPGVRLSAVVIAAGPMTVVGLFYGGLLLIFATVGRNVRWN